MNKKLYLSIITAITAACIIFGSLYHVVGWGKRLFSFGNKDYEEMSVTEDKEISAFTALDADISVGNLVVEEGDSYSISIDSENIETSYEVSGQTLKIKQKKDFDVVVGVGKNYSCEIIVAVPGGKLSEINISSDVGDVKLNDLKTSNITVNCDVGNLEMDETIFDNLTVAADVGNVEIDGGKELADFGYSISCDVGEIDINDEKYDKSYNASGSKGQINITSNVGNVEISY